MFCFELVRRPAVLSQERREYWNPEIRRFPEGDELVAFLGNKPEFESTASENRSVNFVMGRRLPVGQQSQMRFGNIRKHHPRAANFCKLHAFVWLVKKLLTDGALILASFGACRTRHLVQNCTQSSAMRPYAFSNLPMATIVFGTNPSVPYVVRNTRGILS